jgi:hypothetical protein
MTEPIDLDSTTDLHRQRDLADRLLDRYLTLVTIADRNDDSVAEQHLDRLLAALDQHYRSNPTFARAWDDAIDPVRADYQPPLPVTPEAQEAPADDLLDSEANSALWLLTPDELIAVEELTLLLAFRSMDRASQRLVIDDSRKRLFQQRWGRRQWSAWNRRRLSSPILLPNGEVPPPHAYLDSRILAINRTQSSDRSSRNEHRRSALTTR